MVAMSRCPTGHSYCPQVEAPALLHLHPWSSWCLFFLGSVMVPGHSGVSFVLIRLGQTQLP